MRIEEKNHNQPVVGNASAGAKYNAVQFSHFKNIPYIPDNNGREIFRIWGNNDEEGTDGAFFTIRHNLFEQAHGEGTEIISLKSNGNTVENNTIIESMGQIVIRSGNRNRIKNNIIIGNYLPRSRGIRVVGTMNQIANNYVAQVDGGALEILAGVWLFVPQFRIPIRPWRHLHSSRIILQIIKCSGVL